MAKLGPTIAFERLAHRSRQLRIRWHERGEVLLTARKFVEFADGLLRVTRQLAAIETAVAKLPMPKQYEFVRSGMGVAAADAAAPRR